MARAGKTIPDRQGINSEVGYKKPPKEHQWKKGQSGNPKGRPRSITVTDALRLQLGEVAPDATNGETFAELLARALVQEALGGNVQAIREINDRLEGRPRQTVDVSVDDRKRTLARQALDEYIAAAQAEGRDLSEAEARTELRAVLPEFAAYLI